MRTAIKKEIESGNLMVANSVERLGGLDRMTDEQVKRVARQFHIRLESPEEIAYGKYMEAKATCDYWNRKIAEVGEGHMFAYDVETKVPERYMEECRKAIEIMKQEYDLANEWYKFTNHGENLPIVF